MTENPTDPISPDPEGARRQLEEVRDRRPRVERLVARLMRERGLNGFTASVTTVLRGKHP